MFKKIQKQIYLSLILLLYSSIAFAVESSIRFQHLTIEDGLPQNSAQTMLQDTTGFLWFGTQEGLVRYDGYSLKTFKHDILDDRSISDNYVEVIFEDNQGNLWIGTRWGLNHFNTKNEQFTRYYHQPNNSNSLSHNIVKSIIEDGQNTLWFGTDGGGLNHFNPVTKKFTHYRHQNDKHNSLSDDNVYSMIEDSQNNLWFGTFSGGLNHYNVENGTFTQFRHQPNNPNSLSHDDVYNIMEDNQGNLWISTGGGLNHYNPNTNQFTHYRHQASNTNSLSHDLVRSVIEDSYGNIWVATDGGGLNYFNPISKKFTHYQHQPSDSKSLSHDSVWSILEDNQGNIWVGTRGGGLNHFNKKNNPFTHYYHQTGNPNSLSEGSIWSIIEDKLGSFWIGTVDGLNHFNPKTNQFTHYRHKAGDPNSLSDDFIDSIIEDSQGNIWLGTGDGLNYFNPKNKLFTHYRHQASNPNSLSDSNIFSIIEDSQSNLWLGTRDGLNYFNTKNGQVSHYRHKDNDPNSLSYNTVFSILEDNIGNLWIGTRGGGLNHFNPRTKQFTHYRHQRGDSNTLGNDTIFSIVEDNLGNLWVGTPDGLNYFNKKTEKFKHYTTKNGLPNNVIYRIEEDNQGYIWLSTNQGLSRMDPETETFKNFDAGDGLQSNEFNFGASFKSKSGELYFGGINGFNRFYPENITDDQNPPKVLITEMLLLNESVPIGLLNPTTKNEGLFTLKYVIHETKEITLTHTDNIIAFEFAALHFINPKKNQFSYQLVGWDKDWVSTDYKNRRATYTNLPGGDYTFRVKASNSDGYWNEEGASLQITVLPPPWKTWWAYTGYGLIILSLILTFVRSQRKKVLFERHLNAQLEDKVLARTIELEEKNSEILSTQKQLIQSSKMASIGTMTAGVAHEINNPTNFTHAATYLMNDEIFKIKSFLKQLAGGDNADPEVLQSVEHQFTKLVELINTANEGTTRIKTIVEDLRTFARLDDAKQAQVNVADLINSTIHLVRTQYDSIVIETQFDYQPLLTCFPSKLNQVFMNIIINACQAINQKKQIDKQRNKQSNKDFEGRVIIKTSQDDNRLMLTFEDNGCGMTEQTIHRLFEPFFTTKDVGSGTGLGMAISFGIIEEHHGFIEVESTVNEGTKIIIHFDV